MVICLEKSVGFLNPTRNESFSQAGPCAPRVSSNSSFASHLHFPEASKWLFLPCKKHRNCTKCPSWVAKEKGRWCVRAGGFQMTFLMCNKDRNCTKCPAWNGKGERELVCPCWRETRSGLENKMQIFQSLRRPLNILGLVLSLVANYPTIWDVFKGTMT